MLNFHEFLHTMYKYVLNSVVEISLMFDQYSEYYAIILGWGGRFFMDMLYNQCKHSNIPRTGSLAD